LNDKLNLNNWQHYSQAILKEGRIKHGEITEEEDEEKKEKLMKQKLKDDPFQERLKTLSKDKYLDLPTCWIVRAHGDPSSGHRHLFKKDQSTNDVVISLRSLVWPGMTVVTKDNSQISLYVGDGHKYAPKDQYFPKFPYLIMSEPAERKEQPEPTGPEEPKEPEKKEEKKD